MILNRKPPVWVSGRARDLLLPGNVGDYASTPTTLSAELITNAVDRDFSGAGNWSLGVGVAVGGGVMAWTAVIDTVTSSLTASFMAPDMILGQSYAITYTITSYTGGGIRPLCGLGGVGTTRASAATFQDVIVCTTDTTLYFQAVGVTTLSIDNVSVRKIGQLDVSRDISLLACAAADDWTPAAFDRLALKSGAYGLGINTNGTLRIETVSDGTTVFMNTSTVAGPGVNGEFLWVLAVLDVDDGAGNRVARFYTSTNGITWTQLGTTVTTAGATTVFASNVALEIGAGIDGSVGNFAGRISVFQAWGGLLTVDGSGNLVTSAATLIANFSANQTRRGATSFTDSTGLVWTKQGNAIFE